MTPGDELSTAFTHFMAAIFAYRFLSHWSAGLLQQLLVRDAVDLSERDFPWMDGAASEIEHNT